MSKTTRRKTKDEPIDVLQRYRARNKALLAGYDELHEYQVRAHILARTRARRAGEPVENPKIVTDMITIDRMMNVALQAIDALQVPYAANRKRTRELLLAELFQAP